MVPRFIADSLQAALQDTPVVLLHGARQSGKSTLVRSVAESRYITLDDAVVLDAPPELFLAIKAEVDRNREPGRFLLTGSANVLLIPHLAESLAGRMEILTLSPFSQGELAGTREAFVDVVFSEPLPELAAQPLDANDLAAILLAGGGYPPAVDRPGSPAAMPGSVPT